MGIVRDTEIVHSYVQEHSEPALDAASKRGGRSAALTKVGLISVAPNKEDIKLARFLVDNLRNQDLDKLLGMMADMSLTKVKMAIQALRAAA